MSKFEEKTVASKEIFSGKIINVSVDDVVLPNGQLAKRELVKHPGAVAVIALTAEQKVVVVNQFRKPLEKEIIEIPAGKLEPGEHHSVTALRELEEETGYTTDKLDYICSFYTSPGFADELLYIYFTDQLKPLEESRALDEDEFVQVLELSLEELEQLQNDQRVHDAKTVYAIQFLKLRQG
ncbi:ADP-ribose pyrophosphatase [Amphibacillus marinus]|uniref:ADP-ribose pyrophosphatase n=1 Tax=Amphibacillus marinus TaxID=872970 RepID=A0A1H8G9J8_9BACI|nr:NUDIX hydrolase [Amphibacillus marinus]SEN40706.1 ADP-ribose pyrophosphatase [Amphibacillus marinus]